MTKDTPNPPGGAFRREADRATPNGVCEEAAFFGATGKILGRLDADAYLEMIKAGAAFYASFGYTTVQEGRAMPGSATMLQKAGDAGLLNVDVVVYPDVFQSLKEIAPSREYKNRVRIGGALGEIDGVAGQRQPDEVGLRRRNGVAEPGEFTADPTAFGDHGVRAGQQFVGGVHRSDRSGLRDRA